MGEYGFLKEQRCSNVAITRARRYLCLIGDSDTVVCEPFMKGMIEHCHQNGEVWSAHEYIYARYAIMRTMYMYVHDVHIFIL